VAAAHEHVAQPIIQNPQRRSLAQPMGGTWSTQHDITVEKTQSLKSLKIQQHEIEERKKRTISV